MIIWAGDNLKKKNTKKKKFQELRTSNPQIKIPPPPLPGTVRRPHIPESSNQQLRWGLCGVALGPLLGYPVVLGPVCCVLRGDAPHQRVRWGGTNQAHQQEFWMLLLNTIKVEKTAKKNQQEHQPRFCAIICGGIKYITHNDLLEDTDSLYGKMPE